MSEVGFCREGTAKGENPDNREETINIDVASTKLRDINSSDGFKRLLDARWTVALIAGLNGKSDECFHAVLATDIEVERIQESDGLESRRACSSVTITEFEM
jgi:hypothetical protein